jgi:hypothetical protein
MIISASRRTDIPAFYSEWFYNRLKDGYVLVRNPWNIHRVSKVSLDKAFVDGIVFWTKNPLPMLSRLEELNGYSYYFQFTLNSYGNDIEADLPSKKDYKIPAFQKLSTMIGKDRVIWRYDPILFSEKYTMDHHINYFRTLADKLSPYTEKCTISFLDEYKSIHKKLYTMGVQYPDTNQKTELAHQISEIAKSVGLVVDTCAEDIDLSRFGIGHASCVDIERLERLSGLKLSVKRDKGQRPECLCDSSIDIGSYNTCKNGCVYCYANFKSNEIERNYRCHDPKSPLIYGKLSEVDTVSERNTK